MDCALLCITGFLLVLIIGLSWPQPGAEVASWKVRRRCIELRSALAIGLAYILSCLCISVIERIESSDTTLLCSLVSLEAGCSLDHLHIAALAPLASGAAVRIQALSCMCRRATTRS